MSKNEKELYSIDDMLNHIIEENKLKDLLETCQIAKLIKIHGIQHYKNDDNRHSVVIDIQEENINDRTKVLIDLRLGQPIVNQVFDALYDAGMDCDIKIIFYTNGYNDCDEGIPVADEYATAGMIGKLQDMNLPIFIFSISQFDLNVEFVDMYQTWYQVNRLKESRIPNKEGLMCETFWGVYFDSFNTGFYEPWNAYSCGDGDNKRSYYTIYIDDIFFGEIKLFWNENGVRYDIKQVSESDEYLKKVLSVYMPILISRYGEDSVRFENVIGKLPRLYIKYSDRPFNWLYKATPREITEFAKKVYDDAWGLRWGIEETIEKIYEKVPA